jgi:hypothetical protein
MERQCGSCAKCCEGWLTGDINGTPLGKGSPCKFITKNGCGNYENRPNDPCRAFRCEWLNGSIPEHMKPDVCGIIVSRKDFGMLKTYGFVRAGDVNEVALTELLTWAENNAICHAVV